MAQGGLGAQLTNSVSGGSIDEAVPGSVDSLGFLFRPVALSRDSTAEVAGLSVVARMECAARAARERKAGLNRASDGWTPAVTDTPTVLPPTTAEAAAPFVCDLIRAQARTGGDRSAL